MASEKLKKYLAYYQKTLRDDPENIEARLRLAALFREMGNIAHAIEEYVTASKLLAAQGLPLEAIAACKAVLELDPTHTEVQLFLARLFAQAPDAAGAGARIARPVATPGVGVARRVLTPPPSPAIRPAQKIEQLSTDEMAAFERSGAQPITLAQPKGPDAELGDEDSEEDVPTGVHHAVDPVPAMNVDNTESATVSARPPKPSTPVSTPAAETVVKPAAASESTRTYQTLDPRILDAASASSDDTVMIPMDEQTSVTSYPASPTAIARKEVTFAAAPEEIARLRSQTSDEMRETVEFSYIDELRKTQAVDPEQIETSLEEKSQPPSLPASLFALADRRETLPITEAVGQDGLMTGRWHPIDRNLENELKKELEDGLSNSTEPLTDETTLEQDKRQVNSEETFDLKVFDMEGMDLENSSFDSLLDELSDGVREHLDDLDSEPFVDDGTSKSVRINREDLPDIPLFSNVNHRAFVKFLESVEAREFEAGETIVEANHDKRCIYIIARGKTQASKHVDGQELFLGEFAEGDFFGEFELLTGRPSAAQIVASTRTSVLVVTEEAIHEVAEEDPEIWDTLWDVYHIRMLNNLMASNTIFRHLPSTTRDEVLDLFEIEEHPPGQVVLQPEEPCRFVCLVLFGELNLEPTDPKLPSKILREGEFFGFVASLSDDACRALITSTQDTTLLCLSATHFRQLTRQHAGIAREIRAMLRSRVTRNDLFLTGITRYADTGLENGN